LPLPAKQRRTDDAWRSLFDGAQQLYGYHSPQGPDVTVRVHTPADLASQSGMRTTHVWLAAIFLFHGWLILINKYNTTSGKRTFGPGFARQVNNDGYRVPLTIFRFFDYWPPCERKTTKRTGRRTCMSSSIVFFLVQSRQSREALAFFFYLAKYSLPWIIRRLALLDTMLLLLSRKVKTSYNFEWRE
jgi:hypothetical protein